MIKAEAVRTKICTELKDKKRDVISRPTQSLNCKGVANSFANGALLYRSFMTFFVDCMCAKEEIYRPKCVGYRVFLSGHLGRMLNFVEVPHQNTYPDLAALVRLSADIGDLDIYRAKLFLVPIPDNDYYTVYCLNMVDSRIDILESSNEDHEDYHVVVGDRVVPRLNDLFNQLTDGEFKDFSRWKRPVTMVMRETAPNDSAFIAMKVMQTWDGDKLHSVDNQINMPQLRSEMLYFMLYNSANEIKKLPYGLEAYRSLCDLESAPHNQEQDGSASVASLQRDTMDVHQIAPPTSVTSVAHNDYGVATIADTQDDSGFHIRARRRIDRLVNVPTRRIDRLVNVPTRYESPFKCISPRPPIDIIKAHDVRRKICTELKDRKQFIIWGPTQGLRCENVAKYFTDGAPLYKPFMSFFVDCMRAEEEKYRPYCVGFRVFLSGYLGELLNHDEERQPTMYPDLHAFIKLKADIGDIDIFRVKLFFVPIPEHNYYSVYCLNMVDSRIDILDSSNEDHEDFHAVVGDRVVSRLNHLFNRLTDGKFKDFSRWKRLITRVMRERVPNDSALIAMKVMGIWDGNKLHTSENQINMCELRSEMLYYMLYSSINQVKELPYGLEAYRSTK